MLAMYYGQRKARILLQGVLLDDRTCEMSTKMIKTGLGRVICTMS